MKKSLMSIVIVALAGCILMAGCGSTSPSIEIGAGVQNHVLPAGFDMAPANKMSAPEGEITLYLKDSAAQIELSQDQLQLYSSTTADEYMTLNRENLQAAIDVCAAAGGGTVEIAAGDYYFNVDTGAACYKPDKDTPIYRCLVPRDNVTIAGTRNGSSLATTFYPYGDYDGPVNMFDMGTFDLFYEGASYPTLINADFRDFRIDAQYTHSQAKYNANGKGFMLAPIVDCDWYNVVVLNTDGTGFGVDEPVNCTITNCTAVGCGKQATSGNVGASGFGIGYGLEENESMVISNCLSLYNRKFGFFFESQNRFTPELFPYVSVSGPLTVQNCISSGNLYNFGGEMCQGALFIDNSCVYETDDYENVRNIETKWNYFFGHDSTKNGITVDGKTYTYKELPMEYKTPA